MVSVIILTYNQEDFIEDALKGVLSQDLKMDMQILIGNDCSTDNTKAICDDYAQKYPFIEHIYQDPNKGAQRNFVDMYRRVKGKYLALCEGDDFWTDRNKLSKQIEFMEANPDYVLCFAKSKYLFQDTGELSTTELNLKDEIKNHDLLKKNFIPTQTVIYRTRPEIVLDENFIDLKVGDWPLHLLHAQFGKMKFMDEFMAIYRIHRKNDWMNQDGVSKQKELVRSLEYIQEQKSEKVWEGLVNAELAKKYYFLSRSLKKEFPEESKFYENKLNHLPNKFKQKEFYKMMIYKYFDPKSSF